ncbi:WD40 repeat-like protein [Coniophora puteana RWD-64-598 SS2]|uniref:WD40 repeat-like protein n=1 Tax=Coniophora puteana (strain RWD-64-598) TaxID=741705 RepID=A0A5M3MRT3_CONPW|nr:WD40 repeat-like protein [Coniophora puteana RWD-64-598 SS2]EIW81796.1 WD40 repeat-like protein [Coniophora puteana RWD-64-598 SS2]
MPSSNTLSDRLRPSSSSSLEDTTVTPCLDTFTDSKDGPINPSDAPPGSNGDTSVPATFKDQTRPVTAVACSPGGILTASAHNDGEIRIWDSKAGLQVGQSLDGGVSSAFAFSPDGTCLAIGPFQFDTNIRIYLHVWDLTTQKCVLGPLNLGRNMNSYFTSVQYSMDGEIIATTSADRQLRLWDATSGEVISNMEHPAIVKRVAFSPCGNQVASAFTDNVVRVWAVATQELTLPPLARHHSEVGMVAYSPDGRLLASGSADWTVRLWNAGTGEPFKEPLRGHRLPITDLVFTSEGQVVLISASRGKSIRAWDLKTVACLMYTSRMVTSLAWFPDGSQFASAGGDPTIKIWDGKTGEESNHPFLYHSGDITSVDISAGGSMLASSSSDGEISVFDTHTKDLAWSLTKEHTGRPVVIKFTPDGSQIVTAGRDRTVRVWDSQAGRLLSVIDGHSSNIHALSISATGTHLATGLVDGTVCIWDLITRTLIAGPYKHNDHVQTVCWAPNGEYILSGHHSGNARVSSVLTGNQVLTVHEHVVTVASFSPDGSRVFGGTVNGFIRVWETASGKLLLGKVRLPSKSVLSP